MPLFTRAPARPPTRPAPAAPPDFDERLALAALAVDARIDTHVVDYADVVRLTPTIETTTPVADLFVRARQRILSVGWSRDTARTDNGAVCLLGAIQAEARNGREEKEAALILRQLGGGANIPTFNRQIKSTNHAAQVLGQAAQIAAAKGL